ncbi:MAG: GNAT family N-acetyltransferase [Acholeplasmataceae bacterium]|jgi:ribosomal protein S18 acetylase RimI-like enzyme|nr:GNAT family N-acetyltransferase [Acholeplasmataceae bacterium]
MIKEITQKEVKEAIAQDVLNDLSEWFGIPEYTKDYILQSQSMPFFAAMDQGQAVGFVSLKETSPYTLEIYCMGIKKSHHRQRFGKQLIEAAEIYAKAHNYHFLQVKTVVMGKYKTYDQTNLFYKSVGFLELEVFPTLWDEWNPCQILVKSMKE